MKFGKYKFFYKTPSPSILYVSEKETNPTFHFSRASQYGRCRVCLCWCETGDDTTDAPAGLLAFVCCLSWGTHSHLRQQTKINIQIAHPKSKNIIIKHIQIRIFTTFHFKMFVCKTHTYPDVRASHPGGGICSRWIPIGRSWAGGPSGPPVESWQETHKKQTEKKLRGKKG